MADVTTTHPDYEEFADVWKEMRDHLAGSRKIKEEGKTYLPMLGDEKDPHDQANYESYKERALYYEATKRTRQAMLGALLMKPPKFTNFDEDKYADQFKQVTMDGYSMNTFIRNVLSELVGVSHGGVLLDRAKEEDGGQQYFVQYDAEDIINWRYERVSDQIVLTLIVLREHYVEAKGRFDQEEKERYRVLELTDGIYTQSLFVSRTDPITNRVSYDLDEEIVPVNVGQPLDYIPFVFFTPLGNVPTISEPVLSSIATINLSHYRTSADLEHGRHFTGLPTAWVAGFDAETKLQIGSQIAWVSENPAARAGFLEFTGSGLSTLEMALAEKQEQMATMGARMLRPPRTGVEAAETARIYQSAESGTLADLAMAASTSFTQLMQWWLEWQGEDGTDVEVELNTDYVDTRIDSGTLTALINGWMAGAYSYETLFYNLQNGEIMPDGITVDEERSLIEAQGPIGGAEPEPR